MMYLLRLPAIALLLCALLAGAISAQEEVTGLEDYNVTDNKANCPDGLTANDIAARSGLDLTGSIALVTGGRSGMGYAISEALLRQNCTVIIASRNETLNQEAVATLQSMIPGANLSYLIFDLEDFDSVRAFASNVSGQVSHLDYYFANAGRGSEPLPLTVNGYDRIFQTNYIGQFLLVELLLPLLRNKEGDGKSSRILLTGSSSHSLACGNLKLSTWTQDEGVEDSCFGGDTAMDMMPFDQTHLDAVNHSFGCAPLDSTYPISKYLMVQLARELTRREAEAGVYTYAWAPGNIKTDLNPWASCCVGPTESFGPTCRYQLPYVGPVNATTGEPDPPSPAVPNHWSSPAHGAMSAIYTALIAPEEEAGNFVATYWQCQADKGYFEQGMTESGREELYQLSYEWAGMTEGDEGPEGMDDSEADTGGPPGLPGSSVDRISGQQRWLHFLVAIGSLYLLLL